MRRIRLWPTASGAQRTAFRSAANIKYTDNNAAAAAVALSIFAIGRFYEVDDDDDDINLHVCV